MKMLLALVIKILGVCYINMETSKSLLTITFYRRVGMINIDSEKF